MLDFLHKMVSCGIVRLSAGKALKFSSVARSGPLVSGEIIVVYACMRCGEENVCTVAS